MKEEVRKLVEKEPLFKELVYDVKLGKESNYYKSLCQSIVWQQLAGKAAKKIWERFADLHGNVIPERTLELSHDELRSVGLSNQKTGYILDLAQKFASKEVMPKLFKDMSNEEVINELVKVKGIGKWTAEMFLIFSLNRKDVFAIGDYGLQKAVQKFCDLDHLPKGKELEEISEKWKPHRTAASLLLWKFVD